jgi:predicted RNA-binding protein with PUA domain
MLCNVKMCKWRVRLGESAIKQLAALGRAGVPCTVQIAERRKNSQKKVFLGACIGKENKER